LLDGNDPGRRHDTDDRDAARQPEKPDTGQR
jgi:hypothetical protein